MIERCIRTLARWHAFGSWPLSLMLLSTSASAADLTWRVVHPFPLIEQKSFNDVRQSWDGLPVPRTMHGLILARMHAKDQRGDKEAYLLADPMPSRALSRSHLHDHGGVLVQVEKLGATGCAWSVAPPPERAPVDGACQSTMVVARNSPFTVQVRDATGAVLTTTVLVKDVLIVAMGDSYASGEGAPDRPAVYPDNFPQERLNNNDWFMRGPGPKPAVWWDPVCHRSLLSWQVLAALRLALERHDVSVRLLDTACSGAEFFDGLLTAQAKTPESPDLAKQLSPYRDGEGKRTTQTPTALYLARSQVNAVRQELCTWDATAEDVSAKNFKFLSTRMRCQAPKPFMAPDALLLTAGGNDIRFGGAVGGTMLADKASSLLVQPFLYAGRKSLRLISARELASNAVELTPSYEELVDRVAEGALTPTAKTVLLGYPNPIGPDTANLASKCYSDEIQRRVRSAFVAFSTSVRARVNGQWVVEFHPDEIRAFTKEAYPALMAMLAKSSAIKVDWLESMRDAAGKTDYDGRLMCTNEPADTVQRQLQIEQEPVYFCQVGQGGAKLDGCTAKELKAWNAESPRRRIINTTNDAILAQRTWSNEPSEAALLGAASGTFHPTVEAHSVAADSAFKGLCNVLSDRSVCSGP